jgi:hypothetical protein
MLSLTGDGGNKMEHLFVGIPAALFGALAHWLLPTLIEWRHTREIASKLTGDWFSSYQGPDEPDGTWIEELVNIRVPFFSSQVLLKNRDSSHSYSYTASGFIKDDYIYGEGHSVRPAAHAPGAFMLTKAAQGDTLYGFRVMSDRTGARRFGRWVLARKKEELPEAKQTLQQMKQARASSLPLSASSQASRARH